MRKILTKGFVKFEGILGSTVDTTVFQFAVKAPLIVANNIFLHQLGQFEMTSLTEEFYVPATFIKDEGAFTESEANALFTKLENYSKWSFNFWRKLCAEGLSVNQAALILPLNTFVTFTWTVNANDLSKFMHQMTDFETDQYRAAFRDYYKEKLPNEK